MHKILFYNNFVICLYMFRALCAETSRRRLLPWIVFYDLYFTVFHWAHLLADVLNQYVYLVISYPSKQQKEFPLLRSVLFLLCKSTQQNHQSQSLSFTRKLALNLLRSKRKHKMGKGFIVSNRKSTSPFSVHRTLCF